MKPYIAMVSTLLLVGLVACSRESTGHRDGAARSLAEIKASGELRVLTRNAPTTYYLDRDDQAAGPEYELALAFAESLDLKLKLIVRDTIGDILSGIKDGEGDFAAAGLTRTEGRREDYLFSQPIETIAEQVVCRRGGNVAKSVAGLTDVSLEVPAQSSYEESLTALQAKHPGISWKSNTRSGTEPLLRKVWEKKVDCTVADSNIVAVNRRFLPELIVMFDLGRPKPQAWLMDGSRDDLKAEIDRWMTSKRGKAALNKVHYRYYSFIDDFDFVDTRALVRRIEKRLPKYQKLFEKAAAKHALDHTLLAAQAYQESHWDARAESPSGVRGIMMLTQNTAQSLGVSNRLDPKQAIPAGAKYLSDMHGKFSDEIPEPDRTYMALAAYNLGRAHMHDAQTLARKLGKNPHSWLDMQEVLPLLSDKRYYKDLRYGYARGMEPVRYVQRIRNYEDIISVKSE